MNRFAATALAFGASGFAGWAIENVLFGPRYSNAFRGHRVPFLPVYAVGGASIALLSPVIVDLPWPARAGAYAAGLTALELAACQLDRGAGPRTWDYGGATPTGSCVDVPHAFAWGALGLAAESLIAELRSEGSEMGT